MNEFIHTFSGVTYLTSPQFNRMKDTYNTTEFFCYKNEKWVFAKYADKGFRMEIKFTPYIEKIKGRRWEAYKAEWIVTPAKLIYPDEPMAKLFNAEDYMKACALLADIINEILTDSGVNLLYEAKLYRVDVTKDIKTQKHITDPLWDGEMMSKDRQKKEIRKYCGYKTDSAKYKKMIAYRRACNRAGSMEKVKKNTTVEGYFREMGLSPLYCSDEVGCIPAFADLLAENTCR